MRTTSSIPYAFVLLTLALTGCGSDLMGPLIGPTATPISTAYPEGTLPGPVLAVQVNRSGRYHIVLDNRTVHALDNVQIWLNREWGATLAHVPVGNSGPIHLAQFRNIHGEPFPMGSFIRPEDTRPVLKAELIMQGRSHGLNVRLMPGWERPL